MAKKESKRIVSQEEQKNDEEFDRQLRPEEMDEFIGQEKLKENLLVFIQAAKARGDALDHVLLSGPPGLGKTTLARIIANEMGVDFHSTSGPVIEKGADLAGLLARLGPRSVLFIDEIHRLSPVIEEILYPALEDFTLDIILGQGPGAKSVKMRLPPFTLVGATTRAGSITAPLRARFGIVNRFDYYEMSEIEKIIHRSAGIWGVELDDQGGKEMARRSRGTPRIANRYLRRVRDFAQVKGKGIIDLKIACYALDQLEVDKLGLDPMDRKILEALVTKFHGGPVGIDSLAVAVGEDSGTLEEMFEPFLIQSGFLHRTSRGRVATPAAFEYFDLNPPANSESGQTGLF